ncbi:hypothetical protein VitviT2T_025388 [Vitis vinifera]|uniref:Wall-associated receptor kinase galacturonan-binding domain-containing protein n=1 Tax=Vitis vinifera TaxID=29760 RepID=A0ABY9DIW1_VITVI|nr:hypothetical protein VitviT2T_025388 [Vitis vinifera]
MLRRLLFAGFAAIFLLLLLPTTCKAKLNHHLCHSSCGNIPDISYPFRLKDDRPRCGERKYELACENNRTILQLNSGRYYVEEINYTRETIRVVDTGLKKDDCSSLPLHSLTYANFSYGDPYRLSYETSDVNFIDCEAPINSPLYIDMAPCSRNSSSNSSLSSMQTYSYVVVRHMALLDLEDSCSVGLVVGFSTRGQKIDNSLPDIHNRLLYGVDLRWFNCFGFLLCPSCDGKDNLMDKLYCIAEDLVEFVSQLTVLAVAAKIFFGVPSHTRFLRSSVDHLSVGKGNMPAGRGTDLMIPLGFTCYRD